MTRHWVNREKIEKIFKSGDQDNNHGFWNEQFRQVLLRVNPVSLRCDNNRIQRDPARRSFRFITQRINSFNAGVLPPVELRDLQPGWCTMPPDVCLFQIWGILWLHITWQLNFGSNCAKDRGCNHNKHHWQKRNPSTVNQVHYIVTKDHSLWMECFLVNDTQQFASKP